MFYRDIKSDNILLKPCGESQHLVLSDFGCCLAQEGVGLVVPYFTDDTNKGGNGSLMAPEVMYTMPPVLEGHPFNRSCGLTKQAVSQSRSILIQICTLMHGIVISHKKDF